MDFLNFFFPQVHWRYIKTSISKTYTPFRTFTKQFQKATGRFLIPDRSSDLLSVRPHGIAPLQQAGGGGVLVKFCTQQFFAKIWRHISTLLRLDKIICKIFSQTPENISPSLDFIIWTDLSLFENLI